VGTLREKKKKERKDPLTIPEKKKGKKG